MGKMLCNMLSSFILNPKRKYTIRCELKNHHIGSNVYLGLETRSQEAGRPVRTLGPWSWR